MNRAAERELQQLSKKQERFSRWLDMIAEGESRMPLLAAPDLPLIRLEGLPADAGLADAALSG